MPPDIGPLIYSFKAPAFWGHYKWNLLTVIAALIIESVLIAWLLLTRTRRRQAEAIAEKTHRRLERLIDDIPGIVWETLVDPVTGDRTVSFISDYVRKMLGYTPQEWLSTPGIGLQIMDVEDRERVTMAAQAVLSSGKEGITEFRWRTKEGQTRWAETHLTAMTDGNGATIGLRGVTLDITQRKHSLEALREAHEELHKLKDQLEAENIYLQEELKEDPKFGDIVGRSDALKKVLRHVSLVAPTAATVLITGETGTGKELVARAIHAESSRRDRPLIKVNCAALPATLIEAELFGHEKGAFTGADSRRAGRFELANGGTIFLDEIGELAPESQVKLLRVLQEGEFERVGGSKTMKVDVRVIAATNRNIKADVDNGTFREDLWYRLNVFPIAVPPLRQRREDIPLLTEHFVRKFAYKSGKNITGIAPATVKALREYSWPGNIRELANLLERAVINTSGSVLRLRENLELVEPETKRQSTKTLTQVERDYIMDLLEDCGWRVEGTHGAARVLGLNPSTLRSKMSKLGIKRKLNHEEPGETMVPPKAPESALDVQSR